MKKVFALSTLVSILALTGCVNQEQADAKMGAGCAAVLAAQLGQDQVKDVKTAGAETQVTVNGDFRKVNITYVPVGAFDETPQPAYCLFSEQWGTMKSSHTALLEQLFVNDEIYGKKDGVVQGALEDFLKLTDAAGRGMGQQ